ncbi:MAG: DUF4294 domain-containing protein [Bacteroidota bacterium]
MQKLLFILFLAIPVSLYSQQKVGENLLKKDYYIIENDSLTIPLEEVIVLNKRKFDSSKERKYYYWYTKKVRNAYPYAKLASEKMTELNTELGSIKSKRKRKKHIRKAQRYLEEEFTEQVKDMTRTEGRIMIKLIHRQTGETLYDLIKDYRSGLKAFVYNSSARLFKLNLKNEYHPEEKALDFLVEDILQRSFINGALEKQDPQLPVDYFELQNQWKDISVIVVINDYIKKYR